MKKNKNMAFCTITYGENYVNLGDTLIKQINDMGYHMFVLTNDVEHYKKNKNNNITVIKYNKPYFSFHEKKEVIRECLKHFDAAFFLDADVVIKGVDNFNIFDNIENGLHVFATFGNIGSTFFHYKSPCENLSFRNTKYGEDGRKFIEDMGYEYKRDYHGIGTVDYIEHYLEGRWILKKDNGLEEKFLEIWDRIADYCEPVDIELGFLNTIGAGEGAAISIAALNSKIKIVFPSHVWFVNKHIISNYQRKIDGDVPWEMAG